MGGKTSAGDLTSARGEVLHYNLHLQATYNKKYGNASVIFTRSVQRTKCLFLIGYHSKNVLNLRNIDRMSFVY